MGIRILTRLLLVALTLLIVGEYVAGIDVAGPYPAIIAAVFIGILNAVVKPILVVLTLPITLLTLGLFIFFINAVLFWFVASFLAGFTVHGFIPAFIGSLIVTAVSALGSRYIK